MAFIFGVATQEADLYKIARDFLAGFATPGKVTYSGTGTGELNNLRYANETDGLYETFTLTCEVEAHRGGTFGVVGSVSGVLPDAVVGTTYKHELVEFHIDFGDVDYALGDQFVITCMTGPTDKARFAHLMGGTETGDEIITLRCVEAEALDPYVPARFEVSGTSSGTLPELIQGEWYRNPYLNLLMNETEVEAIVLGQGYRVDDTITIEFTRNPLRREEEHWSILRKVPSTAGTQFGTAITDMDDELVLQGPGSSGMDSVLWGVGRHWNDADSNAYWVHYGMGGYLPNMPLNEQGEVQGGISGRRPIHTFWALEIPYTIIASGRCFKLLTRSNIYYSQSYQGLILPSSMPKYYGYPYLSGGTGHTGNVMWSNLTTGRAAYWNYVAESTNSSAYIRSENNTWDLMLGANDERGTIHTEYTPNIMYPHGTWSMYDLRSNFDDTVPMFPIQLNPTRGQLDGVFAIPGRDGRQPEEILVNADGTRAIVMQNHHRSGFNDFCAYILE